MPSNQAIPLPSAGVLGASAELVFYNLLVTGTTGAVAATTRTAPGITITRVATGRYTFTMAQNYFRLLDVRAVVIGPDTASFGTVSVGMLYGVRDVDIGAGANDGTFELQFLNASTNFTDAELPNGTSVMVTVVVDRGV